MVQIKQILKSHESQIISQTQAWIDARNALKQATMTNPADENLIRERANVLGKVEGDASALRAQIRSEIWPILSYEQKAKMNTFYQSSERYRNNLISSIQDFLNSN
jgi:Spy/CpxP family protein refolding chaperone